MTVLGTIIARVVVIVRGIASAEIVVQVIIWHSFYLANPWRLTGPVAAVAWGCGLLAAMIVLAVLAVASPSDEPVLTPFARLAGLISGVCFWVGFFPPNWVSTA